MSDFRRHGRDNFAGRHSGGRGGGHWNRGGRGRGRGGGGGGRLCLFCDPFPTDVSSLMYDHERRFCPVFKSLKAGLTKEDYHATSLHPVDERGFAAAGIIFVNRKRGSEPEFLMSREFKNGEDMLNFLGGKRLRFSENNAKDVAARRADKETGMLLGQATKLAEKVLPLVYWDSESKYAYYFIELIEESDVDIDWHCVGLNRPEVKRLEWIPMSHLLSTDWAHAELHPYVHSTVQQLAHTGLLQRLLDIFDVVIAARLSSTPPPATTTGMAATLFDFDVINAILVAARQRSGLEAADVVEALRSLPKQDVRKLKLRFHPDKLASQLHPRLATEEEMLLSTAAFQLFNNLDTNTDTAAETIIKYRSEVQEFKTKITMYLAVDSISATADERTVESVETLLRDIKLGK